MKSKEIALMGYNQQVPEEVLNMAEQLLWFQMALLRTSFERNLVSAETAAELKNRYLRQFNANNTRLTLHERIVENHSFLYKQFEFFERMYRLNPCAENVEALIKTVNGYHLKVPDEVREQ